MTIMLPLSSLSAGRANPSENLLPAELNCRGSMSYMNAKKARLTKMVSKQARPLLSHTRSFPSTTSRGGGAIEYPAYYRLYGRQRFSSQRAPLCVQRSNTINEVNDMVGDQRSRLEMECFCARHITPVKRELYIFRYSSFLRPEPDEVECTRDQIDNSKNSHRLRKCAH